jgi:hypothetical protein
MQLIYFQETYYKPTRNVIKSKLSINVKAAIELKSLSIKECIWECIDSTFILFLYSKNKH